jgi:hypothetical protein
MRAYSEAYQVAKRKVADCHEGQEPTQSGQSLSLNQG